MKNQKSIPLIHLVQYSLIIMLQWAQEQKVHLVSWMQNLSQICLKRQLENWLPGLSGQRPNGMLQVEMGSTYCILREMDIGKKQEDLPNLSYFLVGFPDFVTNVMNGVYDVAFGHSFCHFAVFK